MRTWRLVGIELPVDHPECALREAAAHAIGLDAAELGGLKVARRSLDARRTRSGARRLRYVYQVDVALDDDRRPPALDRALRSGRAAEAPPPARFEVAGVGSAVRDRSVVVVGSGPAGLFAAHVLGLHGVRVELLDRGGPLRERARDLAGFHRSRVPDPESNLLFGEGGAGTYSDGKLYTRVQDPLEEPCVRALVDHGAPEGIAFDARAHIGTDRLHRILPRLRATMESNGVRFRWRTRMDALERRDDRVVAVRTADGERVPCDALFLAPGHSARDTVRSLHGQGVAVVSRPFQLGVRIEHPQALIDRGRHGESDRARALGPAYYNLVRRAAGGQPSSYSFCMCPGGRIVASVNGPGELCTNGMSNSTHSSPFANAALVTTFGPETFGDGPFDGVAFQRTLERAFFEAGGADFTAPAQHADDFLAGRETANPRRTSYVLGTVPARIDRLLPDSAREAISGALRDFDRKIPGFAGPEGILVGVETRSSSPLRLPRDRSTFAAEGFENLFPVGEGAGYAGGIMSAAIDGARAARTWLQRRSTSRSGMSAST